MKVTLWKAEGENIFYLTACQLDLWFLNRKDEACRTPCGVLLQPPNNKTGLLGGGVWATSHAKLSAESRCKSSEIPRNKAGAAVSSGLWTGPVYKVRGAAGKQAPSTQPGAQRSCAHSLVRTLLLAADGVCSRVLSRREGVLWVSSWWCWFSC